MQDDQQLQMPQQPNSGSPEPVAAPTYMATPAPQPIQPTPETLTPPTFQPNQTAPTVTGPSWVQPQPAATQAPQVWTSAQSSAPVYGSSVQSGTLQRALASKKLLMVVLAAVFVIGITGAVIYLVLHKPITHADVITAQQAADDLGKDLTDATLDYNSMSIGSDSNTAAVTSTADTINSKLDDAQKQLNILNNSAVLRDGNVNKKYQALKVKYSPLVTYIKQNTDDNKNLMPIVTDFESSIRTLSSTNPSTISEVSSYLQSLKSTVDSTKQRLNGVVIESSVNQQGVDALKAYLQSLSDVVAQTQADMAAGKDAFTLEDDLLKSYDADVTYSNAVENVNKQEEANQQKLDASSEVDGLIGAIDSLSLTVKN